MAHMHPKSRVASRSSSGIVDLCLITSMKQLMSSRLWRVGSSPMGQKILAIGPGVEN